MSDLAKRIAGLSPEKQALLTLRLKRRREVSGLDEAVPIRPDPVSFPVSFAQQRLWFLDQLQPGNASYNVPAALRLRGPLHIAALQKSLNAILGRHEILRARFETDHGQPVQRITRRADLAVPLVDLQHLGPVEQKSEVARLASEEARRPFDLEKGPLIRASLIRLGSRENVMTLTMHHIVSDGWSVGILVRELNELYRAFLDGRSPELPELSIRYADYAHWQKQRLQGQFLRDQMEYWKDQLGHAVAGPDLPLDHKRPAIETGRGACHGFDLPAALSESARALGRDHDATLFMVLLAAFNAFLYRYTGQEELCIGTPVAGRNRTELTGLIGLFVNTLVMRTRVEGDHGFRELLSRVRETTLGAYSNQEAPFESLVEALQPKRSLSHSPFFQVMFVLQEDPSLRLDLPGLECELLEVHNETAKFDLILFVTPGSDGTKCLFEYNKDLFDSRTIAQMAAHFRMLLKGLVEHPGLPVSAHPLVEEAEEQRTLLQWNDTFADDPVDACIHHLFEVQAARTPDTVSLVFENGHLTYRELNSRANRLAHHLAGLGVGPETLVGLCMERSAEMLVALLGILKAGGAYVPLDPSYPAERLAVMLEDSGVSVILTLKETWDVGRGTLDEQNKKRNEEGLSFFVPRPTSHVLRSVVFLDTDWAEIALESDENPNVDVTPSNLAYVLFTSGSTGRPKGIAIEHRSVAALLHWARRVFPAEDMAGMLASTSISWDLSVFELFATLCSGGSVILARDALQLPDLADANRVTLINTVPSAISELVRSKSVPASVRTINLAGEPLSGQLVDRLYDLPSVRGVYDLYGPGEDTTYSTFALRRAGGPEVIGRPISNSKTHLLDPWLRTVPIGVTGELFLGGAGLARGYFQRPEQSAERFLPDPFSNVPGARFYKTGDLARYLPDGNIQYLGRVDHQVKIRGFRIEPGEIQAVLSSHPQVREAVVMAREDEPGDRRLVAYVVAGAKPWPGIRELRDHLKKRLPEYMIPSFFVLLEQLPLTPNGKLDRRGLPAPDRDLPGEGAAYVPPRTPTEELLATIWREVLKVDRPGVMDDFFELGGHSLLATQALSRIRDALKLDLPVRELFQSPTIADLAERVDAVLWASESLQASFTSTGKREEGLL